jgi:alginate O-acetyltransferase complex protein AlgI
MLLGGLWHGAAWTFLVWGLLHGIYLVAERLSDPLLARLRAVKFLLFQLLFMLTWLPFRASRFSDILSLVRRYDAWVSADTLLAIFLFAAVIAFSYLEESLERNFIAVFRRASAVPDLVLAAGCGAVMYLLLVGVKYETMFIYQRF